MRSKLTDTLELRLKANPIRISVSYLAMMSLLFIGLPTYGFAQSQEDFKKSDKGIRLNRSVAKKMPARSFSEFVRNAKRNNTNSAKSKAQSDEAKIYWFYHLEFKSRISRVAVFTDQKVSRMKNAYVLTVIDRFADIFADDDDGRIWNALRKHPDIVKVEIEGEVSAPPPPTVAPSKLVSQAIPEEIVRGGYKGLTGKNVIIAILDTGIDFRHPDFISYDSQDRATSRIAFLWDTATEYKKGRGSKAPFNFPNGTSIGTLYTKQQLTDELRSEEVNIPATDRDGHGTACAGIAAGNGNADKRAAKLHKKTVEGVAPEADIVAVRLGYDNKFENTYLLNAIVEWLENVAGKTPLVVSGSFGSHGSGHDGQTIEERQLDARFRLNRPGRAIVFAAGNEGNDGIHAKVTFGKNEKVVVWQARRPQFLRPDGTLERMPRPRIRIYFDSADPEIRIDEAILRGKTVTPLIKDVNVIDSVNAITKQRETTLIVNEGVGAVYFWNKSGRTSEAHLYFSETSQGVFGQRTASFSHLVGSPGTMENAITVGSYDWNENFHSGGSVNTLGTLCKDDSGKRMPFEIGWLSCYSSKGPSRKLGPKGREMVKPDIVAPGEWFSASYAKIPGSGGAPNWTVGSSGNYAAMNGTSAATPYTAGVIALMFEKKPDLTLGEVKRLLKANASKSGLKVPGGFTRAIPNNDWGYGKLDLKAIDRILDSLE